MKTALFSLAQSSCPPNIDFELGVYSGWRFFNGTVADGPVFTLAPSAPVPGREELTSGTTLDQYGLFPIVDPMGGAHSLKLGDSQVHMLAEKATYYVRVPAGANNYSLIYRYAVVLEDPGVGHTPGQKPMFQVNARDSATGAPVACGQHAYTAGSLPGFQLSPVMDYNGLNPYFKPWSTGVLNLSGYSGRTLTLDVIASDCSLGGHFGYGYIDLSCGLFAIDSKTCDRTYATLTAPSGFDTYLWCDSATFTHVYGTSQVITTPIPGTLTTYAVIMKPYAGYGCTDTLYTHVFPSNLKITTCNDTFVCPKTAVNLWVSATDTKPAAPFSYDWSPVTGLSCTTCDKPVAAPVATTNYTVTVTNQAGCTRQKQVTVKTDQVTGNVAQVNDSCYGSNNGAATYSPVTGIKPFTYKWSTTPIQTGVTAISMLAGTYTVTVTDSFGCLGDHVVNITQPPANNIVIASSAGPTTCLGMDGYIILEGFTSGTSYTITYTEDGSPQSMIAIADVHGSIRLGPLKAGVYDNMTVNYLLLARPYCSFNTVGPITLVDPPTPPKPAVGNNGPICVGDTLKLSARDAMFGVTFNWTGPSGFIFSGSDDAIPNATFALSGTYTVTAEKAGCVSSDTTLVKVKPLPVPFALGDTVCSGNDVNLTASGGADAYRWAGPGAYMALGGAAVIHDCGVSASGVYTVVATLNGCSAITTATVAVVQTPTAPLVTDAAYCLNDVNVSPLTAPGSGVRWYTADGALCATPVPSTATVGTTTWYADQRNSGPGATGGLVCVSPKATVNVRVYQPVVASLSASDTALCAGNAVSFIASGLGEDYTGTHWAISGDANDYGDAATLDHVFSAGNYIVSATPSHKACPSVTLSKQIIVFPIPTLSLGPDTSLCPGSTTLKVGDNANKNANAKWNWNTGETSSSITIAKPGVYSLSVLVDGCPASDTITVYDDCYMNMPNAFTPDGDGLNDFFMPREYLMKGMATFKMDIYNRWGIVVYKTSSLTGPGWDGKYNNVLQPEGVFVYRVQVGFNDGHTEYHSGNLTLLR